MAAYKRKPKHYDAALTAESEAAREATENRMEAIDNELDKLNGVKTADAFVARTKLNAEYDRLEVALDYQGANPKKMPKAVLRDIAQQPLHNDIVEDQYRARIKNRATAIRAKCVWCMSGQVNLVKACPSVTCALWPFRMGKDPLRGFELPKTAELELEKEAEDDLFEDEDDSDGDAE